VSRVALRALLAGCVLVLLPPPGALAAGTASDLFRERQALVYQIRVIDAASGDKAAIGSGFTVTADGHIATNFHVVADYVHEPEKYRLEYLARDERTGPLTLRAVDVVHDLAILQAVIDDPDHFPLHEGRLAKGDRIYSMGNPHDLGMTIVEGTYNGRVSIARYRKILFSGSLNRGMSGGPAMTAGGEIMGVNVATGGEQLSFLVPAAYLAALLDSLAERGPAADFKAGIAAALGADQAAFYGAFLDEPLPTEAFGDFQLPAKLGEVLKCWGHTLDDREDERYVTVQKHCATEDQIFIEDDFHTGELFYDYEWLTPGELNLLQFYHAVEQRFDHRTHYNVSDRDDATDYRCENAFLRVAGHAFKASTCQRAYTDYPGLFDLLFLLASVDMDDRALVLRIGATGIGAGESVRLLRRFLESIR